MNRRKQLALVVLVAISGCATGNAFTTHSPPQTFKFYKPGIQVVIQMATEARKLETNALVLNGRKAKPQDAAFLSQSLRGHLDIKTGGAQ